MTILGRLGRVSSHADPSVFCECPLCKAMAFMAVAWLAATDKRIQLAQKNQRSLRAQSKSLDGGSTYPAFHDSSRCIAAHI